LSFKKFFRQSAALERLRNWRVRRRGRTLLSLSKRRRRWNLYVENEVRRTDFSSTMLKSLLRPMPLPKTQCKRPMPLLHQPMYY